MPVKLDWAAYGTENMGHALLGASGNEALASELTQFTDRPGNPPSGQDWGPVTSGFPFRDLYVILRTMPDAQASRSGMVRSYAAFIPLDAVDDIHSLASVIGTMPSTSAFTVDRSMAPLVVSDIRTTLPPTDVHDFEKTVLGICAPESQQPVIWSLSKDYIPTLDAIWDKLPRTLRQKLSFSFQFAPEHTFPTNSVFVATLPGFANRWDAKWSVDGLPVQPELKSGIIDWFRSDSKVAALEDVVRAYGLEIQTFQELRVLEQFSTIIARSESLTFVELTKAVRILELFSRSEVAAKGKARKDLFLRFREEMSRASAGEILAIRNLKEGALPDLIDGAKAGLKSWLAQVEDSTLQSEVVRILETAIVAPTIWWSEPILQWLDTIISTPSPLNAQRQFRFLFPSVKAFEFTFNRLAESGWKWQKAFLAVLQDELNDANRAAATTVAAKYRWYVMLASILCRGPDKRQALRQFSEESTSADGYAVFEREWGFLHFLTVADAIPDRGALGFLSGQLSSNLEAVSEAAILNLENPALLLPATIANEHGTLVGKLREWAVVLIDRDSDAQMVKAALDRDATVLFDIDKPLSAFSSLNNTDATNRRRIFTDLVADGLLNKQILPDDGSESWKPLVDLDHVAQRLSDDPFADEGMTAIVSFTVLNDLNDTHFASWLAAYFTVSADRGGISPMTRKAIVGVLLDKHFPLSAQIVEDTVWKYSRSDAQPILDAIRERYTTLSGPPKKDKSVEKLPKVFIATALRLEYEAVRGHLSNRKYDPDLEADYGLWPSADHPLAEIYVSITEAGNLASQAAASEIFRRIKPHCSFFMGIGGGIKDLAIGDVAYGSKVEYVEAGKESAKGKYSSRPKTAHTNGKLVNLAHRVASDALDATVQPPLGYNILPAVIVSGENVLGSTDDEATRFQIIKSHYNDGQVIEMEGFGFMNAARIHDIKYCMVVRGISDLCKKKGQIQDERNQPVAAKNATDFLFRLLPECLPLAAPKGLWKKFKERYKAWREG